MQAQFADWPHQQTQHPLAQQANLDGEKVVVGVAQVDQPEDRHGVLRGGELGIGAQVVGGFPEVTFEFVEVHGFGLILFFGVFWRLTVTDQGV